MKRIKHIAKKYWMAILLIVFFVCYWFCLPSPLFNDVYTTTIEDENGNLLGAKVAADGQWRFPEVDSLPEKYAKALVAFEDKRFYAHQGFDILAIGRALLQNIKSKKVSEGGSTITMQVIRLARKGKSRNIKEKIIEAFLATRLEFKYTKNQILALYASHAPFGGNVVGIEAAAWRYFGRAAKDLSWAEAATLAVLPNSPSLIHVSKNRAQLLAKRNRLLDYMFKKKYFSEEDLLLAKAENLPESPLSLPMVAMHLFDRIEKTHRGENVTTTLKAEYQRKATDIVNRYVQEYKGNGVNNAAAIIINVNSGKVLAYVGNSNEMKDNGAQVDVIVSQRSSGSILKPFLYAAMIDEGMILPNMLIADYPLHIAGFSPNNYDKTFDGAVPAHRALERSLNVPCVRMLNQYSYAKFHRLLRDLGFSTLTKSADFYGLSMILGGAEATLWDISNAYLYFARTLKNFRRNNGMYNANDKKPAEYISTQKQNTPRLQKQTIISAAAIWHTFNSLSDLNRPEEESGWEIFSSSRRVAWKTGTSYGNRDAWAVGVTPDFVVGVWVGNASGEGRPRLTGVTYAAPILFDLFNILPKSAQWFEPPYDEMSQTAVCSKSGFLASPLCESVDTVWLINSAQNSSVCPYHKLVHLNRDETFRVNADCVQASEIVNKSWFVLPPAMEWYYKQRNLDYKTLPPVMPGCEDENFSPIDIIYPVANSEVVLTKQIDGSLGNVVFQAVHQNPKATIFWHIDDEFVGSTNHQHQLAVKPSTGEHVLILVDDEGNRRSVKFTVRDAERKYD